MGQSIREKICFVPKSDLTLRISGISARSPQIGQTAFKNNKINDVAIGLHCDLAIRFGHHVIHESEFLLILIKPQQLLGFANVVYFLPDQGFFLEEQQIARPLLLAFFDAEPQRATLLDFPQQFQQTEKLSIGLLLLLNPPKHWFQKPLMDSTVVKYALSAGVPDSTEKTLSQAEAASSARVSWRNDPIVGTLARSIAAVPPADSVADNC